MKAIAVLIFLLALVAYSGVGIAADGCAQIVTDAQKDGECRSFATPCDVPAGWTVVENCPDKCANVTCNSPPSTYCSGGMLVTYGATGRCSDGTCSYPKSITTCQHGCSNGKCKSDPCSGVICNSPPASICVNSNTLRTYSSPGTCSGGSCSYAYSDMNCKFGCSEGKCNPQSQSSSTASGESAPSSSATSSSKVRIDTKYETSPYSGPPEPGIPEPRLPASGGGGGGSGSSAAGGMDVDFAASSSGFAASRPEQGSEGKQQEEEMPATAPQQQPAVSVASTSPPLANVTIEKKENATVIISGGARAETTGTVRVTESGIFVKNQTLESEIKVLPDAAQQIAKENGVATITSMKIEMKETAVYDIHGYSEKRLFGILPVKVGYEISLNAREGSVKKVSRPWWSIFAI